MANLGKRGGWRHTCSSLGADLSWGRHSSTSLGAAVWVLELGAGSKRVLGGARSATELGLAAWGSGGSGRWRACRILGPAARMLQLS